jgi:amidophosphoribosyltransferase
MGIYGVEHASELAFLGLYSLQHRGQESAGIVASNGRNIRSVKGLGLLSEAIDPSTLHELPGSIAVGHVRYSTTGAKRVQNIQPLVIEYSRGIIAVAHNGNLTNARTLRRQYEERGSIFQTSTDSEIFVHLMADPANIAAPHHMSAVLKHVEGAYALVLMNKDEMIAARDPHGFRPLSIGRIGDGYVFASETCALDLLGAEYVRDVEPGEIVRVNSSGLHSTRFAECAHTAQCVFEYLYFARPDSRIFGETVHTVRLRMGEELARLHPVEADIVIPVPDSGNSAAMGYSRASGIPLDMGFVRNHYVGRTFISPEQALRADAVRVKLNAVADVVRGKRLVVVDDSIVRGNTCRARIKSLREVGAREVHLRISAPAIMHPCFYGIDFQHTDELIASSKSVEEIAAHVGADSLGYQSVESLVRAVPGAGEDYCLACFNGQYPVAIRDDMDKFSMEQQ